MSDLQFSECVGSLFQLYRNILESTRMIHLISGEVLFLLLPQKVLISLFPQLLIVSILVYTSIYQILFLWVGIKEMTCVHTWVLHVVGFAHNTTTLF